ncbi:hypothetical protein F2Q68_00021312 [Brassica cretica]|uniref:Uncharacterized protein n=1 Tax=Brassica cretica TaxID=69181 RepID=A0A8S9FRH6_BRACR|nr:hypothetical protein F2Q68_00021312 [Brassica cretica]
MALEKFGPHLPTIIEPKHIETLYELWESIMPLRSKHPKMAKLRRLALFWHLVSGCLILCLEMLEASMLGLGKDLGLITALWGAMTTLTYVSRIVFDLIPSRFKFRDMFSAYMTCMALSDGAMVAQILCLGVKDVFTQIAKDVVGQGLDHGRRSLRGLIYNPCEVSCGMIACLDVTEWNERQKPASRRAKETCYVYFRKLLQQIGQPAEDLANVRYVFEKMLVHMTAWSFKKVFLSRKVFSLKMFFFKRLRRLAILKPKLLFLRLRNEDREVAYICPWKEAFSFIVLCEVLAFRDLFRVPLRMFRIALGALLRVFLTCRLLRIVVLALSDGAMVAQILCLGVKDVFTQIAKDVVGRRSLRGLIYNPCKVSCGMIACLDVTEWNERQKPASRRAKE